MANEEHLAILKQGVEAWNQWRKKHPSAKPKLSNADLSDADLRGANLGLADLSGAYLGEAHLSRADLSGAYLGETHLGNADLSDAHLRGANLRGANLRGANQIKVRLYFWYLVSLT